MEGSVRKDGKTIRVRTQLTKTEDGLLLMSAQYDRQLENILKLQEEIAYSVIKELKITVTIKLAASKPVHNEAYLLTQQGNHILSQFNEEAFRSAIRNFTRAINLDPGYSRAYSGLAIAYLESGGWHSSAAMQNIHEAVKHATHAVELDKENADAYFVLGRIHFYQFEWQVAEDYFKKGISLKPSATVYRVWYANFLTAMGRFQEAIDFGIKTIELDPLSGTAYVEVGWTYFHARQDEQSLKFYEQGLALESYYPIGLLSMGWLMSELGNSEEAIRITNKAYQIISENPTLSVIAATNMARCGLKERAQDILLRFAQNKTFYVSPFCLAVFYIVMKDEHKAIEELRNAFSHHDIFLVWLKAFRSFDSIRQHNQFIDIYKKMNFPITQEIK